MDKHLHIIAFNVPYPPNYGGIIDIYYKLKALREQGIKVILHCFTYERPAAPELEPLCEEVHYYPRRTGIRSNLSLLPYNVFSRRDPLLMQNLLKDDYPILFEGLHSCYYLTDGRLHGRLKIYRESNIEHHYYYKLAAPLGPSVKKAFLLVEAARFRLYQKVIRHADLSLVVSMADRDYLLNRFPEKKIEFMASFHASDEITALPGQSSFILYHAKLSVVENEQAALYLIRNVFSRLPHPCVIAGMDPPERVRQAAAPYSNISIEANPSAERMEHLIREAQIHLLVTFQDTGLKLKLLNSLFAGRHIVVNSQMLAGSGLDSLCHIADTPGEMIDACNHLMRVPFTEAITYRREALLIPAYTNEYHAKRLIRYIYGEE